MANDPDSNPYGELDASMPAHYDRALGPIFFADFAEDIARRAAAAAPVRVLETAAGTGIVTRRLRDCLPTDSLLTATDLNPQMLEFLRGKFAAADKVVSQLANATELPFPDGSFDAVVCQFGVMFFPDKEQAYREAYRVLDVGGRYVFSVWDSQNHNLVGRLMSDIAARFFPADPPRFFNEPFTCHRIDPIKESLIAVGFTDLRVSVLRVNKTIPDAVSYARGLMYGSPLADQVRARGGVDPEVMVAAITEALHQRFGADPSRISLQAIVFEATRLN